MNKTITMLIAGLLFPLITWAQDALRVVVTGNIKITGNMKSTGKVYLETGNATNASVENNGRLSLPSGITFNSNDDADGLLLNRGIIDAPADPVLVRVSKKLETFKFYNVSFPFDVLVSSITDGEGNPLTLDTDYYLNYYDIETRAKLGTWDDNGNPISHWAYITESTYVLKAGVGYQVGYDNEIHPQGLEMVFPALNSSDVAKLFSTSNSDKVQRLEYFTGEKASIAATSWGINNIGILASSNFLMSSENLGGYVGWIQYYDISQLNYVNIDIEDENSFKVLPPYTSFFTQTAEVGEQITYMQDGLLLGTAITGLRSTGDAKKADIFSLGISGEKYSDRVKLYSGDNYSKEFNPKEDVIKMFSPASVVPKVWIKKGNESLLIDKTPFEEAKKYNLGVDIETPGVYTFSSENTYNGVYEQVWLTDQTTGKRVNLITDTYRFESDAPIYSNERFSLEMVLKAATGIDNAQDVNAIRVYADNGILYVEGCKTGDVISVYNVTGQIIKSIVANDEKVSEPLYTKGTMLVKVDGATSSKVSKILNN